MASRAFSTLRAVITTCAFRLANSDAAAKPIPEVAPVIRNLFPVKSGISVAVQLSGIAIAFDTDAP